MSKGGVSADRGAAGESSREAKSRSWLTFFVVLVAVSGVVAFGITALSMKSNGTTDDVAERFKFVSATILPLLASWVGTILAFYFSKENMVAATQSVTELSKAIGVQEKLRSLPVSLKMRPLSAITFEQVDAGAEDTVSLSGLLKKYANIERIIILDKKNVVRFLIYKSMVERYISQVATGISSPKSGHALDKLTLKDTVESSEEMQKLFTTSFGFVAASATLGDAKQVMSQIPKCGDVFVTQSGQATEPLLGWVTDNVIAENSTL